MKETISDKVYEEPVASELEQKRLEASRKKRITFSCFNGKVRGDRVFCAKGYRLGGNKSATMPLLSVLRGMSSGACKSCPDYDDVDPGAEP